MRCVLFFVFFFFFFFLYTFEDLYGSGHLVVSGFTQCRTEWKRRRFVVTVRWVDVPGRGLRLRAAPARVMQPTESAAATRYPTPPPAPGAITPAAPAAGAAPGSMARRLSSASPRRSSSYSGSEKETDSDSDSDSDSEQIAVSPRRVSTATLYYDLLTSCAESHRKRMRTHPVTAALLQMRRRYDMI